MFWSSTIIRELALNLAKVIFMLKHLVKLRRYFTECFNVNITLARFSANSLIIVKDRNM
jgi:tRNA U55 pseudouridine synthase TruB